MLTTLNSFIQKLSIILGMNGTKGGSSTTKVFFLCSRRLENEKTKGKSNNLLRVWKLKHKINHAFYYNGKKITATI